jgi:hypothetical protein
MPTYRPIRSPSIEWTIKIEAIMALGADKWHTNGTRSQEASS